MISYLIVAAVSGLAGAVGGVLFYRRNQNKVNTIATVASQVSSAAQSISKTVAGK